MYPLRMRIALRFRPARAAAAVALALVLPACSLNLRHVVEPGRSVAFPTAGPWASLVYAARTDSGVIVVDLGWIGAGGKLKRGLREMGAAPEDVTDVFLTHAHRDHIGAWRLVSHARFHVAAPDVPLLTGEADPPDWPSRGADAVFGHSGPWTGEVDVAPFARDTFFAFGRDTVRAFVVPGHTPGSAAYLFRDVLFVGDAVRRSPFTGWSGALPVFTASTAENRASLHALFDRALPLGVTWVCNAHAKCARPDSAFVRKVTR